MSTTPLDLDHLILAKGSHDSPDDGMCLLEAVSVWQGVEFGYQPPCVSPVLIDFGYRLNDVLSDDKRQRLVPLVPRLGGTAGDGQDKTRAFMVWDWFVRTYTPAWLELAGLSDEAGALRDLPRIVDAATSAAAEPALFGARHRAAAVRATPWDAAQAAARAAAWDAARAAAQAAAQAATRDAARAAARAAAWDAVRATPWDALQPTVDALQDSAIQLYAAMVDPTGGTR